MRLGISHPLEFVILVIIPVFWHVIIVVISALIHFTLDTTENQIDLCCCTTCLGLDANLVVDVFELRVWNRFNVDNVDHEAERANEH